MTDERIRPSAEIERDRRYPIYEPTFGTDEQNAARGLKFKFRALHELLEELRTPENARAISEAQTCLETSCMFAVKALYQK